jgi:hypothetical protein
MNEHIRNMDDEKKEEFREKDRECKMNKILEKASIKD